MSIVMQLQDVAESTRLGPLSGEVRAGEILHLVGPNGAGKSTLLARMAGMTSGKGSIQFAGQPLEAWSATKLALHRAYLSQQQTPPFAMPVWHYLTLLITMGSSGVISGEKRWMTFPSLPTRNFSKFHKISSGYSGARPLLTIRA
jgi:ABC-type cobalamin transport system ATPase subunit